MTVDSTQIRNWLTKEALQAKEEVARLEAGWPLEAGIRAADEVDRAQMRELGLLSDDPRPPLVETD